MESDKMINVSNIKEDLIDVKENAKLQRVIADLRMYSNNPEMLTELYTKILNDDNVTFLLTRISQNQIFSKHFPEFYVKNKYGEDVINCQQNSSYHRYGVFKHILYTIELVGKPQIQIGDWHKKLLKWTMLLHDIGKPYVKVIKPDGTDSFAGHDDKSAELATKILERFDFTKEEKKIILTLIKYHDKFLNEGEIIYDNLKFLATELDNKKDLFYLLINVKDADARAKSIEVYNKYKLNRNKYLQFANEYFEHTDIENTINDSTVTPYLYDKNDIAITGDKPDEQENIIANTQIQSSQLDKLVEQVITRTKTGVLYQPIIDLDTNSVYGYETYSVIQDEKDISIVDFLRYSKDSNKYDKIQQSLFINAVDSFEQIHSKESSRIFANIDIASYESYVNKPRIYDMMRRNPLTLELHNYEKFDTTYIQTIVDKIRGNRGMVALDHFGIGIMKIDDLRPLTIDYIKPDISLIKNIDTDVNKQKFLNDLITFCSAKEIKMIIVGIENKAQLDYIKSKGIRYVQGYYFSYPTFSINLINDKLYKLIYNEADKKIR